MTEPTIYARLLDDRLNEPRHNLRREIDSVARRALDTLAPYFEDQLRRAYMAGVSDGFAQGVAAESSARDRSEKEKE